MSAFVCVCAAHGSARADLQLDVHVTAMARLGWPGLTVERVNGANFASAAWPSVARLRPTVASEQHFTAVGDIRLDNPDEVAALAGKTPADRSHLDLVVAAYARHGKALVPKLHGDFAFAIWDAAKREAIAVRDTFGVKRLFFRQTESGFVIASNLNALASTSQVDEQYVAAYLGGCEVEDRRATIWTDCRAVVPGTYIVHSGDHRREHAYWSLDNTTSHNDATEQAQQEIFRTFLFDSVAARLPSSANAWCELSGGLDTASLIATAECLHTTGRARTRLAGTYTFLEEMAGGDERPFTDAVLATYPLRNEVLSNCYPWQEDGHRPPLTEEPRKYYPFWARDRRANAIVCEAGGRVVMSGGGSDFFLSGSDLHVADLLGSLRLPAAISEARAIGTSNRSSLWPILWRAGGRPLLPARLQTRFADPRRMPPLWINAGFARRHRLKERTTVAARGRRSVADNVRTACIHSIDSIAGTLELDMGPGTIEKTYPFLHKPLVEFALGLPHRMLRRAGTTKWIQREAMAGLVPEKVRVRSTKGVIDGRVLWALTHKRERVRGLLDDPIIAQAGWIDAQQLRHDVERARTGVSEGASRLMAALSLETWLAVRFGRWSDA